MERFKYPAKCGSGMAFEAVNITGISPSDFASGFTFQGIISMLQPLAFYTAGIVIYAAFVFRFYRWLARKDVLGWDLHKRHDKEGIISKFLKAIFYTLENLIVIPLFVFFWSAVLAFFLVMLSKTHSADKILLTSVSIIAAVRIISYFSSDLAKDLAKMVPFTLLGIFLVDSTYFSIERSIDVFKSMIGLWSMALYYLMFTVIIEFAMRIVSHLAQNSPDSDTSSD